VSERVCVFCVSYVACVFAVYGMLFVAVSCDISIQVMRNLTQSKANRKTVEREEREETTKTRSPKSLLTISEAKL